MAHLALTSGAPIVPVGLQGTQDLQPVGSRLPRLAKVTVRFGEPIGWPLLPVGYVVSSDNTVTLVETYDWMGVPSFEQHSLKRITVLSPLGSKTMNPSIRALPRNWSRRRCSSISAGFDGEVPKA